MKRILPLVLAMSAAVASGDTIRIGTMDLPLQFEGEPPTGSVFGFATNEIVRYYHSVEGFLALSPDVPQPARINEKTKATMVWWSPVFEDKINFFVDSGHTNCVVSAAFVTNAAAVCEEWNERAGLGASAEQFLHSIATGAVTNLAPEDLRNRMRTLSADGGMLMPVSAADGTDDEIRDAFSALSSHAEFEPVCLMEMSRFQVGTNSVWWLPVRTCFLDELGRAVDIAPTRLVYSDGIWSILY